MSGWKGKARGGVSGHRFFVFVLKAMGLDSAYFVLRIVVLYYLFFAPKALHAQWYYFTKVHRFSPLWALMKIYQNFYIFGQTLLDRVALLARITNKFTFNFDGEEHLHQMIKDGHGGILMSAHIGNWEIAGNLLKRLNTTVNIVMYEAEHESLKKYMSRVVGKHAMNIIVVKNDFSHIFEINKALKNNELICMHADRYVQNSKTIEVDFMGEKALLPQGPFLLAAKFKVPYSFVYAIKESRLHYHLYATPPKTNPDINSIAKQYTKATEEMVIKSPEQWFNFYKFWLAGG